MNYLKSSIYILFLLLISNTLSAQTDKGNFLIGGGLGFGFSNSSTTVEQAGVDDEIGTTTTTAFDIIPKIGFFFADNFAAGVQLESTNLTTKTENEKNVANKFLAGPFLRYYLPMGDSNKAIFFESNFGFGRTGVSEGDNSVNTSLLGIGVGPGFTIFSNDFIGIEALAKYNWVRGTTAVNEVTSRELVSELDLSLGLQIYFSRMVKASE